MTAPTPYPPHARVVILLFVMALVFQGVAIYATAQDSGNLTWSLVGTGLILATLLSYLRHVYRRTRSH